MSKNSNTSFRVLLSQEAIGDPIERSVENAQKIVMDMLKGMSQTELSEATGINQVTLASLKNGKASRISEKVWSRLVKTYDGTVTLPEKSKTKRVLLKKKAISPQPGPPKLIESIDGIVKQLEALKKQIDPLVEFQRVNKRLK